MAATGKNLVINSFFAAILNWLTDRSKETSTQLGVSVLAVGGPTLYDNATQVLLNASTGNYVVAVTHAIPLVIAGIGAVSAIIQKDKV